MAIGDNKINTLDNSSLLNMKFLQTLYLENNKLRNLDKNLEILKKLPFLKNLNLLNNPLAEEPEYRARVIDKLKSLEILDRHSKNNINFKINNFN